MFGARFDFKDVAELCHGKDIDIFEDAAEAFEGPGFTGSPDATISVFSFGSSKHSSSLGGGIGIIR
jgi:dTDP-4-amino-4,6-dideoxygalactose transaminase